MCLLVSITFIQVCLYMIEVRALYVAFAKERNRLTIRDTEFITNKL